MAIVTATFDDEQMALVPRTPSKEMIEAGNSAIDDKHDSWNYDSDQGCSIDSAAAFECWRVMIAKFAAEPTS